MFERQILSFLPNKQETLADLQKRYSEMIGANYYQGIPLKRDDNLTNTIINALRKAINRRKEEASQKETYAYKAEKPKPSGKTKRDKSKSGYMSSVERKKRKSERDKEIRRNMQNARGKKE